MCRVKSGVHIKNRNDVQNLIIGIINRQQEDYSKEKIYEMVEYNYQGAEYVISTKVLRKMIDDNLSFLYRAGFIDSWNGRYSPQVIICKDLIE